MELVRVKNESHAASSPDTVALIRQKISTSEKFPNAYKDVYSFEEVGFMKITSCLLYAKLGLALPVSSSKSTKVVLNNLFAWSTIP